MVSAASEEFLQLPACFKKSHRDYSPARLPQILGYVAESVLHRLPVVPSQLSFVVVSDGLGRGVVDSQANEHRTSGRFE